MKVRVGPLSYEIVDTDAVPGGEANYAGGQIKLASNLSGQGRRYFLVHEILHVIDPGLSEAQVEALSIPLLGFLVDNADVIAYLTGQG